MAARTGKTYRSARLTSFARAFLAALTPLPHMTYALRA